MTLYGKKKERYINQQRHELRQWRWKAFCQIPPAALHHHHHHIHLWPLLVSAPAPPPPLTFQLVQQQLDVALVSLVLLRPPAVGVQDDAPHGQLQLLQRQLSLANPKLQLLAAQTQTTLGLAEVNHLGEGGREPGGVKTVQRTRF